LRWRYTTPFGSVLLGFRAEEGWQTEARTAIDLTTWAAYDANRAMGSPLYFDFNAHLHAGCAQGFLRHERDVRHMMRAISYSRDVGKAYGLRGHPKEGFPAESAPRWGCRANL